MVNHGVVRVGGKVKYGDIYVIVRGLVKTGGLYVTDPNITMLIELSKLVITCCITIQH